MIFSWSLLALISFSATQVTSTPSKRTYDTHNYYALEYLPGHSFGASLDEVTTALGVEVVEQVGAFQDTWLVRAEKPREPLGSREESFDLVLSIFERLQAQAKSHITSRSEEALLAKRVVSSVTFLERQTLRELERRAPPPVAPSHSETSQKVADRLNLHDPLFKEQWHLVNDEHPENMMNTTPVWDMGFTGKDVLVSYIDDGLDDQAEDLKDAFVRIVYFFTFFALTRVCSRMPRTPTTSTITSSYLNLRARAIITVLGVRAKWQLGETMSAALVLHMTRKLLVSVF
jgi:kexin